MAPVDIEAQNEAKKQLETQARSRCCCNWLMLLLMLTVAGVAAVGVYELEVLRRAHVVSDAIIWAEAAMVFAALWLVGCICVEGQECQEA
jgi:hypothetical protein